MTHDFMLNVLGNCFAIAGAFLVIGYVAGKIQDKIIDRQIKKSGSFLNLN